MAALVLLSAAAAGVGGALRPRAYAGDALVQVEPQQVPDRLVSPPVSGDWQDRLAALSHQILTAASLRQVIQQFHLYPGESGRLSSDEVLASMRRHIEIRLDRSWTHERPGAFHVTFEYGDPFLAAAVADHLARSLIERNVRDRRSSAGAAFEFLDRQLARARRELDVQDARLTRYRLQHAGEIPGQEGVLVAALNRLQLQWQATQDRLGRVEQSRAALSDALYTAQSAGLAVSPPDPSAEHLRQQLQALRARYSDRHPDVLTLQSQAASEPPAEAAPRSGSDSPLARGRLAALSSQVHSAAEEQARLVAQSDLLLRQIAGVQTRLERLPLHEIEWNSLHGDHETARQSYLALLEKHTAAQLSAELERRQKDETFRILEPARVPLQPSGLDWQACAALGALAGLLLGGAGAFAHDLRRNVIQGAWELPAGIPVLGCVPELGVRTGRAAPLRRRIEDLRTAAAAGMSLLLLLFREGR